MRDPFDDYKAEHDELLKSEVELIAAETRVERLRNEIAAGLQRVNDATRRLNAARKAFADKRWPQT